MKDHPLTGRAVKNANGVDVVGQRTSNATWLTQCHTASQNCSKGDFLNWNEAAKCACTTIWI
ncbi:hypothetical protein PAXINDRAFT_165526 [Paxillus involutus ATCC 200175]|nr:hypothetical protein PAXINDRAFT_165526 [Paxillus involutus ATCC 200175]